MFQVASISWFLMITHGVLIRSMVPIRGHVFTAKPNAGWLDIGIPGYG